MNELYIKAINFINLTNPSNHLPYHGIDHLFSVFEHTKLVLENDSTVKGLLKDTDLLIAALFHDYDHSGGKATDDVNINNAIQGVSIFHTANPEFDLNNVIYLIRCTQYPYVVSDEELTTEAKLLRDSDMCYLLQDLSIVKLYSGLRAEFGNSLDDFLNNQYKFISNLKFEIDYNIKMWEILKDKRLKELQLLKDNV